MSKERIEQLESLLDRAGLAMYQAEIELKQMAKAEHVLGRHRYKRRDRFKLEAIYAPRRRALALLNLDGVANRGVVLERKRKANFQYVIDQRMLPDFPLTGWCGEGEYYG